MKQFTAKLTRISLAPIEYFVTSDANEVKRKLTAESYTLANKNQLNSVLHELCDSQTELYTPKVSLDRGIVDSLVVFLGSSACFVSLAVMDEWPVTLESVSHQCAERRTMHHDALLHANKFLGPAATLISRASSWPITLNYIFTYYVVQYDGEISSEAVEIAKILAEPSLVDMDDMLSSNDSSERQVVMHNKTVEVAIIGKKSMERLSTLLDADMSDDRQLFITWESMLCIENTHATRKYPELLLALELRLQMVWNKCFTLSNYADNVFTSKAPPRKAAVEEIYWNFARTLHSAKEIAASTSSARINTIFAEMCRTSDLHEQIDRLSGKITLLSQFIQWKRDKVNARYQKLISLLLLLAAMGAALPAFFATPVFSTPMIGYLVFGVAIVSGLLAIVLSG